MLAAAPAAAQLEIRDIKAAYGPLGPERTSLAVVPGDEVVFRYMIAGIRTDEAGRARGELRMRLTGPDGKVLIDNKEAMGGVLALGGQTLPGTAQVSFAPDMPPGDYKLVMTIRDTLGAASASFERTLTCTKPAFAMVRLRFSQDEAGEIASGAGGILGQTLHIQCKAVGFARTRTKLGVVFTLQVLDTEGKPLMPKPMRVEISSQDAEKVAEAVSVDYQGRLTLNRAGAFRLHISATDMVSNQKAEFVAPLRVTAP
jgi:hypothetical protein